MEGFEDDEADVIIVSDDIPCSQTSTSTVFPASDVNSQGSVKSSGAVCSSQDSEKNANRSDSADVEIIGIVHSQESPFLIPSRQVSTPYWKDRARQKRKCEDLYTPTSVKKPKTQVEPAVEHHSSNGNGEFFSVHNSLEEHTYARKKSSSGSETTKKTAASSEEEEHLQKFQVELSTLCTVVYSSQKKEIVSINVDQVYNLAESLNQSSLSSGRLADDSDSSHHDSGAGLLKPRILNVTNSSSTSSSTTASSILSHSRKNVEGGSGRGIHGVGHMALRSFSKPKTCICSHSCLCTLLFDPKFTPSRSTLLETAPNSSVETLSSSLVPSAPPVYKAEPIVTSTSNSDENLTASKSQTSVAAKSPPKKPKGRPRKKPLNFLLSKQIPPLEVVPKAGTPAKKLPKVKVPQAEEEVSSSVPSGVHQCPPDCKFGKDLLVFAKWPADKTYYPAIVRNCFYTDWEYSDSLSVQFFDGAKLTISSVNIFPASLIVKNSVLTYKNDEDDYIDGIVTSVERRHPVSSAKNDTCIFFLIRCNEKDDDCFGEVFEVPFYSTALNDHCYKNLKKEIGETILTPHKFSRRTYDICYDNLLEGKRNRKYVDDGEDIFVWSDDFKVKDLSADTGRKRGRPRKILRGSEGSALKTSEKKRKKKGFAHDSSTPGNRAGTKAALRTSRRVDSGVTKIEDESSQEDDVSKLLSPVSEGRQRRPKRAAVVSSPPPTVCYRRQPERRTQRTPSSEIIVSPAVKARVRKPKLDSKDIASTSSAKKLTAVRGLVFRNEVVSEEELSDSDPEEDLFKCDMDVSTIGGGDIDYECTTHTGTKRKSCGSRFLKSSSSKSKTLLEDDENLVRSCGPIPSGHLFEGYSFVITHGGQNSYYRRKNLCKEQDSALSTDYEEVFSTPYTFDSVRLKNQLLAGKGRVYNNLLVVPEDSLKKTMVISDFMCQTANYLLAATLNVPVFSHSVIIDCCFKNTPLEKMMKSVPPLPYGRTSDRSWVEYSKKRKVSPLKGYVVVLASTETNQRLAFWAKVIHLAGGKISYFTPDRHVLGGRLSCASVVIVDDYCPTKLSESAVESSIPLVSTRYLVDTLLRGCKSNTMLEPTLSEYSVSLNVDTQHTTDLSQS